jgi:RNA ligase
MAKRVLVQNADGTTSYCYTENCKIHDRGGVDAADAKKAQLLREFAETEAQSIRTLGDIAPMSVFEADVAERFINVQHHPELPLDIYNYTQAAQFNKHWTPATLASRGLIVNRDTLEIVSRPLGKFFNYSENKVDPALLQGPVVFTEKLDGSCGISYPTPDGLAIATRGSFTSDQALHATQIYRERYHGKWRPKHGRTYMWEIIYPTNRIVVNYGEKDDIVLIAAVDNRTGKSISATEVSEWPGERVEAFPFASMEDVLAAPTRNNHEGYVAHYLDSDVRVKYKHDEYVNLHRIMTGVNARRIWEVAAAGQSMDMFLADVPEEFETYVRTTERKLYAHHAEVKAQAQANYERTLAAVGADADQKTFAQYVMSNFAKADTGYIFSLRGGQTERLDKSIWSRIEPAHEKPFWSSNEDPA